MGSVVSSAASGLGTLVGNALAAPIKALGASCEGVCTGVWDVLCFVEHLCFSSLIRFVLALFLALAVLLAVRLLCKLGLLKLVAKIARDVAWRPCAAACRALGAGCGLLWRKVRHTKRVHRGRRGRRRRQRDDVEMGEPSTSRGGTGSSWTAWSSSSSDGGRSTGSSSSDDDGGVAAAARSRRKASPPSVRDRRKDRIRQSLRLKRVSSKVTSYGGGGGSGRWHRHSTGPRRTEVVVSSWSALSVHGSPPRGHSHGHRHRT